MLSFGHGTVVAKIVSFRRFSFSIRRPLMKTRALIATVILSAGVASSQKPAGAQSHAPPSPGVPHLPLKLVNPHAPISLFVPAIPSTSQTTLGGMAWLRAPHNTLV